MGSRKLQSIGGGTTFAVSLPKTWIESMGLAPGDEILVEPRTDGTLVIRASPNAQEAPPRTREVKIDSGTPASVLRTIIGLYVSGFDAATLTYAPTHATVTRMGVAEACERLHGLQVVEEGPTRVVMQDLADAGQFNMDRGLRRMQLLVLQLLANAHRIAGADPEMDALLRENARYEAELDRLLILLLKQHNLLVQRGEFLPANAVGACESLWYMFVAQFLERVGDYALRVTESCHLIAERPHPEVSRRLQDGLTQTRGMVEDAIKAFNTKDANLANDVIERALSFAPGVASSDMFDAFTSPRTQPQVYSCHRCIRFFGVLESVERIAWYAKSIAEAAINRGMSDALFSRRMDVKS